MIEYVSPYPVRSMVKLSIGLIFLKTTGMTTASDRYLRFIFRAVREFWFKSYWPEAGLN